MNDLDQNKHESSVNGLTLVLGGVSSGKSSVAERRIVASGRPRIYIATAQARDAEMQAKIADHITERGPDWTTIETPLDVSGALAQATAQDIVLLDCATMWLSNVMEAGLDLNTALADLLTALRACPCPVVVVSNEVGLGGISDNALARRFARAQGRVNAQLAQEADHVLLVVAGLPQVLK